MTAFKFSHIAPKSCMQEAMEHSGIHMALYHLTNDDNYCKPFREAKQQVILDNSFYELGTTPPIDKLIRAAQKVNADFVVLPDGTLDGLEEVKAAGFKVMAIPAGPYMLDLFNELMHNPAVDLVGLSFYHARLDMGSNNKYEVGARFNFLQQVESVQGMNKKLHILGMGDSVHEINLLRPYWPIIHSWDTSAAVWYGLNGRSLWRSTVKFSVAVDFDTILPWDEECEANCQYINDIIKL